MHICVHVYHLEGEEKLSQGSKWTKAGGGVRKGKVEDMGVIRLNAQYMLVQKNKKISI